MGVAGSIWAGLLLQAGWVALADLLCLTDGIARDSRRFIPDPDNTSHLGAETPIRLVLFDWPSATVASTLAAIFIREVLGYHAVFTPDVAPGSLEGAIALAGCATQDCSLRQALGHVAMDCWMSEILFNFEQFVLANPDVAPIDLGSIGYSGENALAVRGSVREAAYASSGLALEFYRSYNVSAHDAAAYFDRISDLKLSHFHPCNTSSNEFANDVEMRLYGKWTGDWAGVVETDSGYIANCPDGHFWISPACRHNTSECIPVLAAGNGWIVYVFMQWSTFYQIPAAIGISKNWETFTANVAAFRVLFHWWIPDATFHHLDASMLQLPRHKAQEWAVGNYRSADPQSYIAKLVAHSLGSVAPKVQEFLENFDLDLEDMQALLQQVAAAAPVEDVACEWIRTNRARWEKWVPVDTQCLPGYGLRDEMGNHVPDRSAAVACSICLAGKFSEILSDDVGGTHRCMPCPAGTFQSSFGETGCVACDVGTFSGDAGHAHCERCHLGRYANTTGMTECHECGGAHRTTSRPVISGGVEKWVDLEGATSETFCGCVQDWYLTRHGHCEKCPYGSECPGSSQLLLLPGFYATPEEPGLIFRCFGKSSRCPGGPTGSCKAGRDARTVTCYACLPGLQPLDTGECGPCTGVSYAVLPGILVLTVGGIMCLYAVLAIDAQRTTQPGHLFVIVVALSQVVTVAQQLAVITKFDIQWAAPMSEVMGMFELMTFDLDLLSLSCMASVTPAAKYALTTLAAPLLAVVAILIHLMAVALKNRVPCSLSVSLDCSQLFRTIGSLFLIFFISAFSAILAPFQCSRHPNGRLTLQDYGSVFCDGKDEHLHMCMIGFVASLMPIFFLALCIRATWFELPKRLVQADAQFVQTCSFLWRRFRPGAETFAIFGLIRNVCIVLCPLIHADAVQLVTMNIILYLSLVATAVAQPWRLPASNVLDMWLHVGLLVVMDMASVFAAQEVDAFISAIISMLFLSFMAVGILLVILHGIVLQVARSRRKPWRFFLSHHKRAAGAFARLLKIHLQKRSVHFTTFLDTDNLRDLTELFSFVRASETVVVLASAGILARKWCIGEIVSARLHKIHTLVLKWPAFIYPNELFCKNLTVAIPGVEVLTAHGISLNDVADAMTWLRAADAISVPDLLDAESISRICDSLTGMMPRVSTSRERSKNPKETSPMQANCLILADPRNQEAVATSYILVELLVALLKGDVLPIVLQGKESIPENSGRQWQVLLVCSSGCFKSSDLAYWLIDLYHDLAPVILPIAGSEFVVPLAPYEDAASSVETPLTDHEHNIYCSMIGLVFQEIAIVFAPQSSTQEDLELRVKQIALRLQAKSSRPRTTSMLSVQTPRSPASPKSPLAAGPGQAKDEGELLEDDFFSF